VLALVTIPAQALELAVPELDGVAVVVFDVMHDVGDDDQVDGLASLAQRLLRQLVTAPTPPTRIMVGAAAIVAAAFGIERIEHAGDAGAGTEMAQADERARGVLLDRN